MRPDISGDLMMSRKLSAPLRYVYGQQALKERLRDALERLSDLCRQKIAEGEDSSRLNRDMRSAVCEELTYQFLIQAYKPARLVRDAWAYDGDAKILPDSRANLDFARGTMISRDLFWEVFECKQNPVDFFASYRYRNDIEQRAKHEWERSQIRLAIEIQRVGGSSVAIRVVCYRPQVEIDKLMRHVSESPEGIEIYSLSDAIRKLPHCRTSPD